MDREQRPGRAAGRAERARTGSVCTAVHTAGTHTPGADCPPLVKAFDPQEGGVRHRQ